MLKFKVKIRPTAAENHQPLPGVYYFKAGDEWHKESIEEIEKSLNRKWLFHHNNPFMECNFKYLSAESFFGFLESEYSISLFDVSPRTADEILRPLLKASNKLLDYEIDRMLENNLAFEVLDIFNLNLLIKAFGWENSIVIDYFKYLGYRYEAIKGYDDVFFLTDDWEKDNELFKQSYEGLNFYDIEVTDINDSTLRNYNDWYIKNIGYTDELLKEINCDVPNEEPECIVTQDNCQIVLDFPDMVM